MYDFSVCKLCREKQGIATYRLKETTIFICGGCGFHYIDHLDEIPVDPATEPDLTQQGFDYIERMLAPNGVQQRSNLALVQQFCNVQGLRCLDVGAGAGLFCKMLADAGAEVSGLEPQKAFRQFASSRFHLDLVGETVDHPRWQSSAGTFDVVTIFDVLEHVNFPRELLESAFNLLQPGGWLFIDTPSRDTIFYRVSELSWRLSGGRNSLSLDSLYSPRPFRHKQIFNSRQLTSLLERIGFTVVRSTGRSFLHTKLVLACRKN